MNIDEKIDVAITICKLQSMLEGYDFKKNCKKSQLTIKLKILMFLFKGTNSPYVLTKNIGIAKTNLNLICNEMIKENLICKHKEEFDKRAIYYSITDNGKNFLFKEIEQLGDDIRNINETKISELNRNIKSLLEILK